MKKDKTIKIAMAFVAFLDIQAELLEGAKSTPLYRQLGKNLINKVSQYTEEELNKAVKNGFYDNGVIEKQMQGFTNAGQDIVDILQNSTDEKLSEFLDLLQAFKDNRYTIKD